MKSIHILVFVFVVLHTTTGALAASPITLSPVLEDTGLGRLIPALVVIQLISYALNFLGLIVLIVIIWAGFSWIFSGGNSEKLRHARDRLVYAIIGLAVILASYGLAKYVFDQILKATSSRV